MAAVENGADAVYLGGKTFSARQYAGNFDNEEMKRAIEYCHIRGVRVFVTVNTLLKDRELKELPEYVAYLYNEGVDALIIQDIGVGKLIKEILPDFELHASTQMTAHNLETVNFLYEMGYKRVVLSRELSLNEVKYIVSNTKAEIEIFSHGALCICYSGQCLMSSMIGGRSGNRGRCAQPCRQRYTIKSNDNRIDENYILSPKDLSTLEHIGLIAESGVKSLKVEGRMKKPEYVANVISTYRKALDNYVNNVSTHITDKDKKNMLKIFNRGGFTTAHLFNKGGREMMSLERPKNWGLYIGNITNVLSKKDKVEITLSEELSKGDGIEIWTKSGDNIGYRVEKIMLNGASVEKAGRKDKILIDYKGGSKGDKVYKTFDIELNKTLEKTYKFGDFLRKVPVNCEVKVERNRPSFLRMYDDKGNEAIVEGQIPEEALKLPLIETKLKEQVSKFGGTPFYLNHINIKLDENLMLPISVINTMRRQAVDKLIQMRIDGFKPVSVAFEDVNRKAAEILNNKKKFENKGIKISVHLKDSKMVDAAIKGGADIIIFGGDKLRGYDYNFSQAIKKCKDKNVQVFAASPRIIRREFGIIVDEIGKAVDEGVNGIYGENLGIIGYNIENKLPFSSGFSMNIFNSISAKVFVDSGSKFISLSPELSLKEIKDIAPYIENCETLCYGRIEMMVSEYCLVDVVNKGICKDGEGLRQCNNITIMDRVGMEFPVKTDIYCRSHVYNSKILSMLENVEDVLNSGVNMLGINILDESEEEVYKIVKAFKDCALSIKEGRSMPGNVIETIKYIKDKGYTKGHYYRGVD